MIYLVGIALSTFSTTEASKSIKNSSSKYYFLFLFSIVFRHLYKVDETHLYVTINDNLIWHLSSKYGCEVRVLSTNSSNMTNTTLQNWCQKKKTDLQGRKGNIPGKCIPSACESVYGELPHNHRETVRLP